MPAPKKRKVNFNSGCEPGIAALFINQNYANVPASVNDIKHGHILYLFINNNRNVNQTEKGLRSILNCSPITHYSIQKVVQNVLERFRQLTDENKLNRFKDECGKKANICFVQSSSVSPVPKAASSSTCLSLVSDIASSSVHASVPVQLTTEASPHKTRSIASCSNCKYMKSSLRKLLEQKNAKRIAATKKKNLAKKLAPKRLQEKLKRRDKSIFKLKEKVSDSSVSKMKVQIQNLKKTALYRKRMKTAAELEMLKMKKELQEMKKQHFNTIRKLENYYEDKLLQKEEELENKKKTSSAHNKEEFQKVGNAYNYKMRLIVYECLTSNVQTEKTPGLIQSISRRFGVELVLKTFLFKSSVENMMSELGLLSDLQVAELIYNSENVTLAFDATTQEGVHVNAINVSSETQCLVLALDQLPGGTAMDYSNHIIDSVRHLARVFCDYHPTCNFSYVHDRIISHISCSLTDRAAANHAALRLVNESFGKTLIEVNCHLHPLDTIATKCRTTLQSMEGDVKSCLFGSGCLAEKVILALNKMRYKDGKGDPHGFRVFLQNYNLPESLIVRYRGNKLHVLFKLAEVYITQHEAILKYLTTRCLNTSSLKTGLIKDFSNQQTFLELKVLAVVGKVLTGPWMRCFYSSQGEQIHHMDAFMKVKECRDRVEAAISSDRQIKLEEFTHDYFGDPLNKANGDLVWKNDVDCAQFSCMFKAVMNCTINVIQKQYTKYYDMDVTDDMRQKLKSARTHNIDTEEVMGMFSANQARAPNATLQFMSAKIRSKKNNTITFISSHSQCENLIMQSVSLAAKQRRKSKLSVEETKKELSKRIADKMRKKEHGQRKKMEKQMKELITSSNPDFASAFPVLDSSSCDIILDIVSGNVVGRTILHNWASEDSHEVSTYNGKIEKFKRLKSTSYYSVCYWGLEETYEEQGEDYKMHVQELAVDFLCGDLQFSA